MAIMECMFLSPYDEAERPPAARPIHWLGVDDDWTEAPELGLLARVFNQDCFNLPKVQKGLHTLRRRSPASRWPSTRRRRSATSTLLYEQWLGL